MHYWHYGHAEGVICLYLFHDPVYNQKEEQVWETECISRK